MNSKQLDDVVHNLDQLVESITTVIDAGGGFRSELERRAILAIRDGRNLLAQRANQLRAPRSLMQPLVTAIEELRDLCHASGNFVGAMACNVALNSKDAEEREAAIWQCVRLLSPPTGGT